MAEERRGYAVDLRTDAQQRRAFLSPWPVFYALSSEIVDLPPAPPRLPTEITHVWLCGHPIGRCLAWFPGRGWLDPSRCWATD